MKTTRSSGPWSTEFSYLFSFFPHSPPSSHFFSWFSSQSNGSRFTEFSHLFSFFPHATLRSRHNVAFVVRLTPTVQEIISHPIRSRHVDPVEFVVRLTPTVHGAISHPIRSRHVDPVRAGTASRPIKSRHSYLIGRGYECRDLIGREVLEKLSRDEQHQRVVI